ncbi:MAG: gamma-glutamyl-gamma-aminobutyrate hydrolase family protein [bacterium]|nr:gamma-glutamyl-gamma-aminobutyrate hydrolase family protein [bacterium]
MAYRPKIGITMRLEYETNRLYLGRHYAEAIEAAGGTPVHIALIPKEGFISNIVSMLDGVLLPGSASDLDPGYWNEDPHPKVGRVIPEKDQTDLMVLAEAETREIPVFGICFGMQSLNVSRGGSLIQDIESDIKEPIQHQQGIPRDRNSHAIRISSGSIIEKALGVGSLTTKVNSHHHQAIRNLGKHLRATAWANDGVIEAVEDIREGRFSFGVQWHPELSWSSDALSGGLFRIFVEECSNRRRSTMANGSG